MPSIAKYFLYLFRFSKYTVESYTFYKFLNSNPYTYKYYYTMKMSIRDSLKC